jgi:hypothetical protein
MEASRIAKFNIAASLPAKATAACEPTVQATTLADNPKAATKTRYRPVICQELAPTVLRMASSRVWRESHAERVVANSTALRKNARTENDTMTRSTVSIWIWWGWYSKGGTRIWWTSTP